MLLRFAHFTAAWCSSFRNSVFPGYVIADTARMTDRVAKTFGGTWQDIMKQAAQESAPLPMPQDVLKYIKGFV